MITLLESEDRGNHGWGAIAAVSEREPIRDVESIILGEYLRHIDKGVKKVQQMIYDDLRVAMHRSDQARAKRLFSTLQRFIEDHPETERYVA